MNPQERDLLTSFLQQMRQAQGGQKDAEADALIAAACARQPDAAYLLVQRAMQLEYALQGAQSRAASLQTELEQLRPGTGGAGFLDNANAWGRGTPAVAAPAPARGVAGQPSAQPGRVSPGAAPAWGSGMLGTVASTAAGVVAGSFLFQGIQGLMGQRDSHTGAAPDPAATPSPLAADNTWNTYDDGSAPADAGDLADAGGGDLGDSA